MIRYFLDSTVSRDIIVLNGRIILDAWEKDLAQTPGVATGREPAF
jgi:hypothetical protein